VENNDVNENEQNRGNFEEKQEGESMLLGVVSHHDASENGQSPRKNDAY
jgi:hypothetical protein